MVRLFENSILKQKKKNIYFYDMSCVGSVNIKVEKPRERGIDRAFVINCRFLSGSTVSILPQ